MGGKEQVEGGRSTGRVYSRQRKTVKKRGVQDEFKSRPFTHIKVKGVHIYIYNVSTRCIS